MTTTLYRGNHKLPHQAQAIRRDLDAERIARHPGGTAQGYMLTDGQVTLRREGRAIPAALPYRFLIYSPASAALNWTAFYTRDDLAAWLDAYGATLDREPKPGEMFVVRLPDDPEASFRPLTERDD